MSKTDVATAKSTAVSTGFDYGDMAHEGFEETKIADLSIPFINVLQSLSPEVEDQTVPGAKAGDMLNSVTKEIVSQPLVVIPIEKEESWVEWVPRNKGGGLVGRFEPTDAVVLDAIKKNNGSRIPPKDAEGKRIPFKSPDGNDLIETHYVYALIVDEEGGSIEGYCVLAFASAKIKAYKDWMTALYTQKGRPPIFANRAKISTTKVKNESGTFFVYNISPFAPTWRESLIDPSTDAGMALLNEAKAFRDMIKNGLAKPNYDSVADSGPDDGVASSSGNASQGRKRDTAGDDEIPF